MAVYDHQTYRKYLDERLNSQGPRSGLKKRAAEALKVHTTLISQILSGECELSLEQAEKMNGYLKHDDQESQYFILLVLRDRAGTPALRRRFDEQLDGIRAARVDISKRVSKEKEISDADQEQFYSSFIYGAIHVLSSIPRLNRVSDLSRLLGMPEAQILKAIEFLSKLGVIAEKQGVISPGNRHVHLSRQSKYISSHHLNWRLKAIEKIRQDAKTDLHYSGAMSLSLADVQRIKELLASSIADATRLAVESKEETAYVLGIDFFSMTN